MNLKNQGILVICLLAMNVLDAQTGPWNNPLRMAWSDNGATFGSSVIFQDSSGVPSVIRWKGDTLICAFQWFRQPKDSPGWDRVAVKFSYDNGKTWTTPTPITLSGLPSNFQRPFDPTLTVINKDSIRIYFSSSEGKPAMGLDATVNTYSAKSTNGVNYFFEPVARVDEPGNKVIDPAVIFFNNKWHFIAPVGAPQEGAYHYLSDDGLKFSKQLGITSDNLHNWTGNFLVNKTNELRFYGSGPFLWFNTSTNGTDWTGYTNTNLRGGDPTVVKISESSYLIIYVGAPYLTGAKSHTMAEIVTISPNPVLNVLEILSEFPLAGMEYKIFDVLGNLQQSGLLNGQRIEVGDLHKGLYVVQVFPKTLIHRCFVAKFIRF